MRFGLIASLSDPTSLADYGLIGAIFLQIFGLLALFLKVLSKKDKTHQETINTLLHDEREERKSTTQMHTRAQGDLSAAIRDLTRSLDQNKNQ